MIYFIQAVGGGPIKIGTTAWLSERLKAICKEAGDDLQVLAVVAGGHPEEAALHRRFVHLRVHGEWFEPGDDLLGFIVAEGRAWDGSDEGSPRRRTNDSPVKVDAAVLRDARLIAASRDISVAEYISEALRPIVARDLRGLEAELAKRSKALDRRSKKEAGE